MSYSLDRRAFLRASVLAAGAGLVRTGHAMQAPQATPDRSFPIIDSHQHLWDLKRFNLPWLANAPQSINHTFNVKDFQAATAGLNVDKTIYMEVDVHPAQQVQEAEFAIGLCEDSKNAVSGAVIGGYPHEKGFAEYLKRFAAVPCVKGVRTVLHAVDRPPGLCLNREFVDSMKRLGDAGLTFDLCMRPDELLSAAQLAAKCPDTTFVLDHCGNIGLAAADASLRQVWCEGVRAAAAQTNIVCKISGLIDKAGGVEWNSASLADNVNFCLDAFGEDRVLFGGDWPVCLLGGSYLRWVDALEAIVADRPEDFRTKLFRGNAIRVYRLA